MKVRVGAPPTGHLGLADARWALLTFRLARDAGGTSVLVLEDADPARGKPAFAAAIEHDFGWLGMSWERVVRQSERVARYGEAAETLRRSGRLFPCFESEDELRAKRDRRARRGQPTVYDRAMLHLTPAQRAAAEAGGKRPYWRFRLSDGVSRWHDALLGERATKLAALSDPVLVRADGVPLRLFAEAVDDLDLGVTHALRDAAHEGGSAMALDVRAALGGDPAALVLAHLPALTAPIETLRRLRADGVEGAALAAYLAGGDGADEPIRRRDMRGLAAEAPTRFDAAAMQRVNRRVLATRDFSEVAARLPAGATDSFWRAIRGGIDLLGEAATWWDVVRGDISPPAPLVDPIVAKAARATMPGEPWSGETWRSWVDVVARVTGRSDAAAELRRALVGDEEADGPAMDALLPLIGPERSALRLRRVIEA